MCILYIHNCFGERYTRTKLTGKYKNNNDNKLKNFNTNSLYLYVSMYKAYKIVACSAGFSLAARSADISMWYPLILLLVPAALSYWTSRRRATFVYRIRQVGSFSIRQ